MRGGIRKKELMVNELKESCSFVRKRIFVERRNKMKKIKIMSLLLSLFCTMSVASLAHAENNTVTNGQITFYTNSSSKGTSTTSSSASTSPPSSSGDSSTSTTENNPTKTLESSKTTEGAKEKNPSNQTNLVSVRNKTDMANNNAASQSFGSSLLPKMADSPQIIFTVLGVIILGLVGIIIKIKNKKKL